MHARGQDGSLKARAQVSGAKVTSELHVSGCDLSNSKISSQTVEMNGVKSKVGGGKNLNLCTNSLSKFMNNSHFTPPSTTTVLSQRPLTPQTCVDQRVQYNEHL